MLNSAWPSLYWQLYDWYMVPTAGYFGTKKACAPVQLIFNYGDRCVWAVNDAVPLAEYTATVKIYGPDSKLIREDIKQIRLAPRDVALTVRADHLVRRVQQPFALFFPEIVDDCFHSFSSFQSFLAGFTCPQHPSYRNPPKKQASCYQDALRPHQVAFCHPPLSS